MLSIAAFNNYLLWTCIVDRSIYNYISACTVYIYACVSLNREKVGTAGRCETVSMFFLFHNNDNVTYDNINFPPRSVLTN